MYCHHGKAALFLTAVASCLFFTTLAGAASVFDDAAAYWAFEEGEGNTIGDSVTAGGAANMAIADGSTPYWTTGMVGGGLQVNHGDNQYATTGVDVDKLDFNSRDDFSVAGWVMQHEGSPVFIKMANTSTDNYRGWHLETKDDGKIDFLLRSTNSSANKIEVYGKGRIPMGEWVHLAATYHYDAADSTLGVRIYVNGSLFDSYVSYGGLATEMDTTNNKPFQFTAREGNEFLGYYDTSIDEVGIWNRALSQAEVQELVNEGVPDMTVPNWVNYIENGSFENTTGWVAPGTGVLPPSGWASDTWKNNPADQATGTAAVGGTGTSALMVDAHTTSGINQPSMAQSFIHATESEWQFDVDFATEAPSSLGQRTFAVTIRTNHGAQIAFLVTSEDDDGTGNLMVGGASGYENIVGLEDTIVFDNDLSDLSGGVHHLTIQGHFDDETPNYDVTITDPSGNAHTVTGLTTYSGDMGALVTGAGIGQVGFYTYKSYGDYVIDNVSLVNVPEPSSMIMLALAMMWLVGIARAKRPSA